MLEKRPPRFAARDPQPFSLHPGEAVHGDLGIVTEADILIALSNSGETDEVIDLIPFMSRLGVPIIAITGSKNNSLANRADYLISMEIESEADSVVMAPTTSTTVALAVCDALAIALMHRRGFTREQFAIFHPGGNLGRKLLLTVANVMHTGERIPLLEPGQTLREAIPLMSAKGLGAGLIVDNNQNLCGIFTDGDLRRTFANSENPLEHAVENHMTLRPASIQPDALAAEALRLMEARNITVLPVVDASNQLVGVLHLHDLVRVGLA